MYEAYLNNKFTNGLIMYILFFIICVISPFLFLSQIINTIAKRLRPSENLSGKVVLITGASSGIGEYLAYEYAKKGACLAIVARREDRLKRVAEKARELGSPDVLHLCADISKPDDCKRFVDETINHFGCLDHLVNNAGINLFNTSETDTTKCRHVMDINFWGSVYPTSFAIPHLKKSKGKIIVNASASSFLHPPNIGFYSASKAAIVAYFESLRIELSSTVKITIVNLGYIETEMGKGKDSNQGDDKSGYKKDCDELFPVMGTEPCVKAIVEGACRGERFITEPKFMKVFFVIKFLFPEFMEWYFRSILLPQLLQLIGDDEPSEQTKAD